MERYNFEEINSAGQAFYVKYHNFDGDIWCGTICTDEECKDVADTFTIRIGNAFDKYDMRTKMALIEQEISDIVKRRIEEL